ncbi:MAG: DUF305 domain-containing protein [Gemmatimonadaceae bacterium]|nr:DUF305 domain-containing protein [Caulobacter sp.]
MRKILIAVCAVTLLSAAGVTGASAQSMAGHDMKGMDMSKSDMKGHAQMGRDALKMDEMRMSKAMMAAKASDFDVLWARKMIAHHQGAIDMSQSLLEHGGDADAKRLAQMTIDENTKAKADLEAFIRKHGG